MIESGYVTLLRGSGVVAFSGLSFRLSKKFLEYGERLIDKKNYKELFDLILFQTVHNSASGNWDDIQDYDENKNKEEKISCVGILGKEKAYNNAIKLYESAFENLSFSHELVRYICDELILKKIFL